MTQDNRYKNKPGRKEYIIRKVQELRVKRKAKIIEISGGKCIICGYEKCNDALEFHHRVPEDKCFELNSRNMSKKWDIIVKEAAKCDLLCSNCHREIHFEIRSSANK